MVRRTTLRNVLLIVLLIFLITSLAGTVSAGTDIWTSNGPEGGAIYALAIDPTTHTTLYAGTDGGVFKSTNDAGNWNAVNSGSAAREQCAFCQIWRDNARSSIAKTNR